MKWYVYGIGGLAGTCYLSHQAVARPNITENRWPVNIVIFALKLNSDINKFQYLAFTKLPKSILDITIVWIFRYCFLFKSVFY